ncbi:hypothetical protein H257_13949 [Aphanomyces astaci]|uniref:FHA domain-containing protein n=1 Tax=Aphanomyces astaci TaxID=112090 RepID=W4FSV2_APHAT|nr:hypothetical protein H257_13949 [Aphanomyces astaci]ETV70570.1 hypothetical protein H257_13949 [Aphanomyces astaci]|eukprot:XP_009839953.1 hypothetical protein H257_13949 [Aphanomyces astaci]
MTAYEAPEWALNGSNRFGLSMEVIKGGIILEKVELVTSSKSYFVAGRMEPLCDIVLQHPSVSRTHAALQFDAKGQLFLVDLGSTHGTFVNKKRISAADHIELHVGDVVVFGESTRIYTILGPVDLMPDEYSSDNLAKLRSKLEARKARRLEQQKDVDEEGASWGFREDAVEEDDSEHSDDSDNDTFSTSTTNKASSKPNVPLPDYLRNRKDDTSGPYVSSVTKDTVNLTKDSKLYTRLQNRIQKLENLKLESSRIRAKQNVGLTDGQEAALARNDTRTQELQDEIEMLEAQLLAKHTQRTTQKEVAAVVAKSKKSSATKAKMYDSDDDDFYDRTKNHVAASTSHHPPPKQVLTFATLSTTLAGLRADLKLLDAQTATSSLSRATPAPTAKPQPTLSTATTILNQHDTDNHVAPQPTGSLMSDVTAEPSSSSSFVSSDDVAEREDKRPSKRHSPEVKPIEVEARPKRIRHRRKGDPVNKKSAVVHATALDVLEGGDVVWQPPTNQTGDGRTSLNDKFGY